MFLVRATIALFLLCAVAYGQSSPGFIDGAILCANYPNTQCSQNSPTNPLSLNQAFANKVDYNNGQVAVGSGSVAGVLLFPFNGQNTISLRGGATGTGGVPRLAFLPTTTMTGANYDFIGIGSVSTWPSTSYGLTYQGSIVDIIDPNGTGALLTAMRTSDWVTGNYNPTTVLSITVHDNSTLNVPVWGAYDAIERTAGASASPEFFGREMSFHNLGAPVTSDPFTVNPSGGNFILRLDSGVGTGTGNNVTSALDILNNGAKFSGGINFGATSIDTVSSHIRAIMLPTTYELTWFSGANTLAGSLQVDGSNVMHLAALSGVNVDLGPIRTQTGAAPGAGTEGLNMSSTSNLGVFFSNGTPTVSATNGSLDLDTTGKIWLMVGGAWAQITVP